MDNTSTPHGRLRRFVSGKHLNTLDRLFEHPPNLNIHWKDVQKMFASMGAGMYAIYSVLCFLHMGFPPKGIEGSV